MRWLVTGGAGYIGAHVVQALRAAGHDAVVLDDLSTGVRSRVDDVPFVLGDVADRPLLVETLRGQDLDGVVHLAAKKSPAESVADPLLYYRENVGGFVALLEAMRLADVPRIVLSSSAAVYGLPASSPVTEDAPLAPINPYGHSKAVCEQVLHDEARARGLSAVVLRYFNVAGAGSGPALADRGVANLVPLALTAIARGEQPVVFGTDYATPDGSGVRDYVHVVDLADAHVAAAQQLGDGGAGVSTYNVGRGEGFSVLEVLATAAEVTGIDVHPRIVGRRPGDPAAVVGDVSRIRDDLGWTASRGVRDMVASAWAGLQATR